jgi:hypothetical protein
MPAKWTQADSEKLQRLIRKQAPVKVAAMEMGNKVEAMAATIKAGKNRKKDALYPYYNFYDLKDAAENLIRSIDALHAAEREMLKS